MPGGKVRARRAGANIRPPRSTWNAVHPPGGALEKAEAANFRPGGSGGGAVPVRCPVLSFHVERGPAPNAVSEKRRHGVGLRNSGPDAPCPWARPLVPPPCAGKARGRETGRRLPTQRAPLTRSTWNAFPPGLPRPERTSAARLAPDSPERPFHVEHGRSPPEKAPRKRPVQAVRKGLEPGCMSDGRARGPIRSWTGSAARLMDQWAGR